MPSTPAAARAIVDEVFGRGMTREIWTGNYEKVLPVSVQDFDLGAILPAVFYMFRFGGRRGKGRFVEQFGEGTGAQGQRAATIERISQAIADGEHFAGFGNEIERAILGDLLLCYCLENRGRALGRHEQVQRVAPSHYLASWVDLPRKVADLRYVPEMVVALLADQEGEFVDQTPEGERSWFAVGRGFDRNVLLGAFNQGMEHSGLLGDRSSDRFREDVEVGLDQLLMIRLAQKLGQAPDKLQGKEHRISNQRPIAQAAARDFAEDLRRFVRAYAGVIPRLAFVELLESCMAVGLSTIVTSTIDLVLCWATTGAIRVQAEHRPPRYFVDCSNGIDRHLRAAAEQSLDDLLRRVERFPIVLMALRVLDYEARYDPKLKRLNLPTCPYATDWLNLLGDLLYKRRDEAAPIHYALERKSQELAERLQDDYPDAAEILADDATQPNPVWRLAEALTLLQGRTSTQNNAISMFDSALLINRPHGLAARRAVSQKSIPRGAPRQRDARSLVLTDPMLDYLVHRHVLRTGKKAGRRRMSLREFLETLRDRHGLCIAESPPDHPIASELLLANRAVLERRLRDLGLLVGVNDAESMKHLQPRYERGEADHGVD